MKKFIYVMDEDTKQDLLKQGFRLLKDNSLPYIFANNVTNFTNFEGKKVAFSDVMQF